MKAHSRSAVNGQDTAGGEAVPFTPPKKPSPGNAGRTQSAQIVAWLAQAMQDHRGDPYPGKRDKARFRDEFDLEATLEPDNAERAPMRAVMHNICTTGIAFWIRSEAEPGNILYLRDYGAEDQGVWVETKVTHCTRGIRGFLIGAEFLLPISEDDIPKPVNETPEEVVEPEEPKKSGFLGWLGLS